jgi:hypothetical protein
MLARTLLSVSCRRWLKYSTFPLSSLYETCYMMLPLQE